MHKLTGILDKAVLLTLNNRPSKIIKSPYVADAATQSGRKVLVHTPFLNLGEQCKNRSRIYATLSNENSKTDFIAQLVEFDDKMYGKVIIGANPFTAEKICKSIIMKNLWNPFDGYQLTKKPKEIEYRGDLYLKNSKNEIIIIEVKNVVCASYNPNVSQNHYKIPFYDNSEPFIRSGIYPFGDRKQNYKGKKVVSERSIRQLDFMISNRERLKFAIIFVVNRSDCNLFKANWQGDPVYAKYLNNAADKGIELYALKINWKNFSCYFDRSLEVDLNKW